MGLVFRHGDGSNLGGIEDFHRLLRGRRTSCGHPFHEFRKESGHDLGRQGEHFAHHRALLSFRGFFPSHVLIEFAADRVGALPLFLKVLGIVGHREIESDVVLGA